MSSNNDTGDDPTPEEVERKRFIYQVWDRNRNGRVLKRDEAPLDFRGHVWRHSPSDMRLVEGLLYIKTEIPAADQHRYPRVLQPWPLLCVPNEKGELETLCIGGDEGCESGHENKFMFHRLREVDDQVKAGPIRVKLVNITPEKKKIILSEARSRFKDILTRDMDPDAIMNDPRFHIPDQSVPSNERLPPKLEEFIPREYLPDVLLVHDPQDVTVGIERCPDDGVVQFKEDVPIRYTRMLPKPMTDGHSSNVAHLYLSSSNLCGRGNHSFVYHAPLMLPAPLTARTPTRQVTVLAKTSFPEHEHRDLLDCEGVTYDAFPHWMMEDYCGYNFFSQIPYPVPACAIVPKFYGFYVPEDKKSRLSPILLLEDCGSPIRTSNLTSDARAQLHSMFINLHHAGFIQGSVYFRNILIQPGPLTVPPSKRSLASPSFRIIDFGRAEYKLDHIRRAIGVPALEQYEQWWENHTDFATPIGEAEAEKRYSVTVYNDGDGEGKEKGKYVKMVMGLEEPNWKRLCKAWNGWTKQVTEADRDVQETLGYRKNLPSRRG